MRQTFLFIQYSFLCGILREMERGVVLLKKIKRIWIFILAAAVCFVSVLAACFWDTIVIYAAPKAVLSQATKDTISQLDIRFRYNPIRNLLDLYSPEGQYTVSAQLQTETELLGPVSCDVQVSTDAPAHQAFVDGTIHSSGGDLDLSLFLNGEYMALSSQDLVDGKYYGITYDSFVSDLDRFPLIKFMIPDASLGKWENTLLEIQSLMNRPYEVPQVTQEDMRLLMVGILLLDSKVSREVYDGLDCWKITYGAEGQEIKSLLSNVLDTQNVETAEIAASFYLKERTLVGIEITGAAGENSVLYMLHLGEQCLTNDLCFTAMRTENGSRSDIGITVSTSSRSDTYQETIILNITADESNRREVSYSWDSNSGDMVLSWNQGMPVRMNVTRNEDGLRIATDDFAQLMAILAGRKGNTAKEVSCVMTLMPGSAISAPEYSHISQWSSEDLLQLLRGLGRWLGIAL